MKLDHVVVGIGDSESSVAAARWAARHFVPAARITLVRCLPKDKDPGFLKRLAGGRQDDGAEAAGAAEDALQALARELDGGRVSAQLRREDPSHGLPAVAEELGADLVCIGEPSERDFPDLRGTTERLLHHVHRPVLVVRDPPSGPPRRVLAAVDDSVLTVPVLRAASGAATAFGAELRALHVVRSSHNTAARQVSSETKIQELDQRARESGMEWLAGRLREAGWPEGGAAEVRVGSGAESEIRDHAASAGADLIVLGSRGAGGLERLMVGSVARALLHEAPCPVLLVPRG